VTFIVDCWSRVEAEREREERRETTERRERGFVAMECCHWLRHAFADICAIGCCLAVVVCFCLF